MANTIAPQWFTEGMPPTRRWLGQYTELGGGKFGHNKEWLAELFTDKVTGHQAFRARWGKTGAISNGGAQIHWIYPASDAVFDSQVNGKIHHDKTPYTAVNLADTVVVVKSTKAKVTINSNDPVAVLTRYLLAEAGHSIKAVLRQDVGLQDLDPAQVEHAKSVLRRIAAVLNQSRLTDAARRDIITSSNEYYSLVPHQTGNGPLQIPVRITDPFAVAVSSLSRLEAEYDFLDTLSAAVANKAAFAEPDTDPQMVNPLGAAIKLADAATTKRLQQMCRTNLGRHRLYAEPGQVFEVTNDKVQHAYQSYGEPIGNVQMLYHGSRNRNWQGILSQGIRIKPVGVPQAGSMFGNGAYFADNPMKSYGYTEGNIRYLLVADVALGKIKVHESSHHYNGAPDGYHSVQGRAGMHLAHNEFIIYDTRQHNPRYLVEFK